MRLRGLSGARDEFHLAATKPDPRLDPTRLGLTLPTVIVGLEITLAVFSTAKSPPTYRCSSRPNLNWSSTSRPPSRSTIPETLLATADEVIQ
jgi:hypothetical protein